MLPSLPIPLIRSASIKFDLSEKLISAVIVTESYANPFACRYEPAYRWLYETRKIAVIIGATEDTVIAMQRTSWGLMQVMGAVAYEHMLHNESRAEKRWASSLILPETGIEYGCRHLKHVVDRFGPSPDKIYAAYNAGSVRLTPSGKLVNQVHVNRFLNYYRQL